MVKRSATATIAGYLYQFDFTIKSLLDLSNENDSVDIENIEDENACILSVKIHNLNSGNVQGRFQPSEFSSPVYYFSLTGTDTTDSQDKIVFFSLFRGWEPVMTV